MSAARSFLNPNDDIRDRTVTPASGAPDVDADEEGEATYTVSREVLQLESANLSTNELPGLSLLDGSAVQDITLNLPTLEFASALKDQDPIFTKLRARSHALTFAACANCAFFVGVINEARRFLGELSDTKKIIETGRRRDWRHPFPVSVIGCGRLGRQIVDALITYAGVETSEFYISSRRPEILAKYKDLGIQCFFDNKKAAASARILFVCVPPTDVESVANEVKNELKSSCVVVSLVAAVPISKLRLLLAGHQNIIKMEFYWEERNEMREWDISKDVISSLQDSSKLERACPLTTKKRESIVCTRAKVGEQFIYAFVNAMTEFGIRRQAVLELVHIFLLGEPTTSWGELKRFSILESDLTSSTSSSSSSSEYERLFPVFDLCAVAAHETPLTSALKQKSGIVKGFLKRFLDLFEQYTKLKLKMKHHQTVGWD